MQVFKIQFNLIFLTIELLGTEYFLYTNMSLLPQEESFCSVILK